MQHDHMLRGRDAQHERTLLQLPAADMSQAVRVARAEAEKENAVPELRTGQPLQHGGEEHGLIVRVRDQQADAFARERGE